MAKYNGLIFEPYRQFTNEEKDMSLAQIDRYFGFTWDYELGMFDREEICGHPQKIPYSHEDFYKKMGADAWADIFICRENGKYYIPCSHTVMEIKYHK